MISTEVDVPRSRLSAPQPTLAMAPPASEGAAATGDVLLLGALPPPPVGDGDGNEAAKRKTETAEEGARELDERRGRSPPIIAAAPAENGTAPPPPPPAHRRISTNPVRRRPSRSGPFARRTSTASIGSAGSAASDIDGWSGRGDTGSPGRRRPAAARVLSAPPNLGRDELSLNKLRFSDLGLYGRDLEILTLREAYDEVRLRGRREREARQRKMEERKRERRLQTEAEGVEEAKKGEEGTEGREGETQRRASDLGGVSKVKKRKGASRYSSSASSLEEYPRLMLATPSSQSADATAAPISSDSPSRSGGDNASSESPPSSSSHHGGGPFSRLVLISGRSGCGKSALAASIRGHVRRTGGLYASGKFDAFRSSEPYTAFVAAFSGLCDEIIASSSAEAGKTLNGEDRARLRGSGDSDPLLKVRDAVRDAVGSELTMLREVVPNLSRVLGEDVDGRSSVGRGDRPNFEGTKNRFLFAMRQFLRAVCSDGAPLVLVLDDLQWADLASLDLLQSLLSDRQNPHLLVLGSYRDDEVASVHHPFNQWMRSVEGCCDIVDGGLTLGGNGADADDACIGSSVVVNVTHINLSNIDQDAVNNLLADLLSTTLELTKGLSNIVHRRTHGNGFAIVHFLKSLHEEGILYYCLGTLRWMWDDEEVRSGTDVTDNVADLMTNKIENHLSEDVQEVLMMASCLGFSFDAEVLSTIASDVVHDEGGVKYAGVSGRRRVVQCLNSCVEEGLVEAEDEGSSSSSAVAAQAVSRYRFTHDQIAAAAFALIPESERESLQLGIGEALLKNLSECELERDLFVVVGLLNRGVALLRRGDKRRAAYAALNLRAGRKAMDASAFEPAATYLCTGVHLLGDERWRDHPALTLDLLSTAAEAECVNANQEEMRRYIDEILARDGLPVRDKVRAYCTLMHSLYLLQDKTIEALDVGLLVLEKLGVCFPRKNTMRATVVDLVKTKLLLRQLPFEDMTSLPLMEDETRLLQMKIMNKICDLAYFARPDFVPWVVFKMVRISVKRGLCKYSSGAFASYGLLIVRIIGDAKKAHEFEKVALALLKRFDSRELEARVIFICNSFISYWLIPAYLTHKRLLHGYEVGMQTGDTGFAMMSLALSCMVGQFLGKPLPLIESEMQRCARQMRDHKQEKNVNMIVPVWQLVLNLLGRSEDPSVLNGKVFQLEDMLCHCDDKGNEILRNLIESHQIFAGFYFGKHEFCGKIVQRTKGKRRARASVITWRRALFDGLTAFELARRTKSRKWKTHAAKVTAKVRGWAEKGNVNCTHVQFLLEAERAALEGKHVEAREKYEKAISTASRRGFLNDRALANERAGEYFLEHGDKYFAAHHLGMAHQLYSNWGAVAKVDHLYDKHRGLFDEDSGIPVGMDIKRRWSD